MERGGPHAHTVHGRRKHLKIVCELTVCPEMVPKTLGNRLREGYGMEIVSSLLYRMYHAMPCHARHKWPLCAPLCTKFHLCSCMMAAAQLSHKMLLGIFAKQEEELGLVVGHE